MADCSNIFSSKPGRIVRVKDDFQTLFSFAIKGPSPDPNLTHTNFYATLKAIVTSIGIQEQGGYQFLHTLTDFIYLYVFNERVGEVTFSGLAFAGTCDSPDNSGTGMVNLLKFYEKNRITSRKPRLIITFGDKSQASLISFVAFLTNIKIDIVNTESGLAQWVMRFAIIPNYPAASCSVVTENSSSVNTTSGGSTSQPSQSEGYPPSQYSQGELFLSMGTPVTK